MTRILVTAFEPFWRFAENSSRLCLRELERDPPSGVELIPRVYPVDFVATRAVLERDLADDYAASLHLGQSNRGQRVDLEMFALNTASEINQDALEHQLLEPQGPAAYRSLLPLPVWSSLLRADGLPVEVSHHAGAYLCNATSYWAHHWNEQHGRPQHSLFVHVPLAAEQGESPSLPLATIVASVRGILQLLAQHV